METVMVSRAGRLIGHVRFDPLTEAFEPTPGIPADVMSDIVVTFYRESVLFGRSGDGYVWSEAPGGG